MLLLGPLMFALLSAPPALADALPRPVALESEIAFWRRIFSEIESNQGLIHDNRHLSVVYGTVYIPVNAAPKLRRKLFAEAKDGYAEILGQIVDGDRSDLSAEQQAVLALWPKDISNDELKQAAERLRVQQGLADRFEQGLVRSGQWLSHIQSHLQQAGVPQALAALPHVESSFDPTAYSHVGAAGLWQFTRSTGKHFMQIDQVVDSRRDPYMSSEAAAKFWRIITKGWAPGRLPSRLTITVLRVCAEQSKPWALTILPKLSITTMAGPLALPRATSTWRFSPLWRWSRMQKAISVRSKRPCRRTKWW